MSKKRSKRGGQAAGRGNPQKGSPQKVAPANDPRSTDEAATKRRPFDTARENIEALVVAVILALVIRHFAVEAFEIPTGSMATTLNGIHAWLECPNCDCEFNVALRTDAATGRLSVPYQPMRVYEGPCPIPGAPEMLHQVKRDGFALFSIGGKEYERKEFPIDRGLVRSTRGRPKRARCPECSYIFTAIVEENNRYGGHKILVTKFAYQVSDPARWDVIVFTFDQWKNYIKRLIGLPGERIDLWDGDVYVNGEIERKATHPYIQDVLWRKIFDSDRPKRELPGSMPAWTELAAAGSGRDRGNAKFVEWDRNTLRFSVNAGGETAVLDFGYAFDDYTAYNLLYSGDPRRFLVGDKKVALTVRPVKPGEGATTTSQPSWLGAEIRDRQHTFQMRIPVGATDGAEAVLERLTNDVGALPDPSRAPHPEALRATAPFGLPYGSPARIEFENLDDRVALSIDGEEVLVLEYSSLPAGSSPAERTPPSSDDEHSIRLVFSNLQGMMESVQVYRDIYYRDVTSRVFDGETLGPKEYLALGDNSASSSDGRFWGAVPEKSLMGKAFVVIWPLWPTNFQGKRIR